MAKRTTSKEASTSTTKKPATASKTASRTARRNAKKDHKYLDVALQGGGSHGAFTWGVLDYFLEQEEKLTLEGICGTSAGAVNGAVLAYGLMKGGAEHARQMLQDLWYNIATDPMTVPFFKPGPYDRFFGMGNMDHTMSFKFLEILMQFSSPYDWNPYNLNPLKDLLNRMIDFEELRACQHTQLWVCATNVFHGRLRVFDLPHITADAVCASACLPFLFQAVMIDDEPYWDGGYMGNPPLFPLIENTETGEIMIIQVNPVNINEVPKTAHEIHDRINEISFNSSLMLELRRVEFARKLLEQGIDLGGRLREINIHLINPEETIAKLNISSKLNTDWDYLTRMRDIGRGYAQEWMDKNYEAIGTGSTCQVAETYF